MEKPISETLQNMKVHQSEEFELESAESVRQTIYKLQTKFFKVGVKYSTKKDVLKGKLIVIREL